LANLTSRAISMWVSWEFHGINLVDVTWNKWRKMI
jgi:hypothetical protein